MVEIYKGAFLKIPNTKQRALFEALKFKFKKLNKNFIDIKTRGLMDSSCVY